MQLQVRCELMIVILLLHSGIALLHIQSKFVVYRNSVFYLFTLAFWCWNFDTNFPGLFLFHTTKVWPNYVLIIMSVLSWGVHNTM